MNFWTHFRETWHEGVTLAAGYVVVDGWHALGLPSGARMAVEAGRAARFWLAAVIG